MILVTGLAIEVARDLQRQPFGVTVRAVEFDVALVREVHAPARVIGANLQHHWPDPVEQIDRGILRSVASVTAC
jgi:hypothetical protein